MPKRIPHIEHFWFRVMSTNKMKGADVIPFHDVITDSVLYWATTRDRSIQCFFKQPPNSSSVMHTDLVFHNIYGPAIYHNDYYEYWVNGQQISRQMFEFFYNPQTFLKMLLSDNKYSRQSRKVKYSR